MLKVNGKLVIDGRLTFPRTGVWHASLRVDTQEELSGAVTIDIDEGRLALAGTVARGGDQQDAAMVRIVGGANGLRRTARARNYTTTSVREVLGHLLADAGEALAATADQATLSRTLDAWTTHAMPVGLVIPRLLASGAPRANWRMLTNGTVWVGAEQWADSGFAEEDYQILSEDPARGEAVLGMESPLLLPGTKLGDRRVSLVEHHIGEVNRTNVWFETGGGVDDRLRGAVRGLVRGAQHPVDYLACYWATVVAQSGGRVDVRPIDQRFPPMAGVPLLAGIPKWELSLSPGGRVLVGWSGGDPAQPYALAFDADVAALSIKLLAPSVTIGTEAVAQPAILSTPYRGAETTMNTILAAQFTALAAASTGPLAPLAAAFGLMAAAIQAFEGATATFLSTQVRHS
jgi:hypothetical protein